jgi:hypothetical protein
VQGTGPGGRFVSHAFSRDAVTWVRSTTAPVTGLVKYTDGTKRCVVSRLCAFAHERGGWGKFYHVSMNQRRLRLRRLTVCAWVTADVLLHAQLHAPPGAPAAVAQYTRPAALLQQWRRGRGRPLLYARGEGSWVAAGKVTATAATSPREWMGARWVTRAPGVALGVIAAASACTSAIDTLGHYRRGRLVARH